ncbi:Long-chain-fatty-acid--CoA ligase FadD13 [Thalassobacter stenotrophicus]|uniref:Long-chain-fatty-acid--CoA ligase FadD13 n=2 Tax=Thalassobacter stenotrophicus TaxID=266809 RepID=A0A0P1FJC2_9RHOB|nr:Long-chain-fatty-acid--CoA ligase FadD13 [Thalassobacter stenotrophicus]SHJ35232.1 AMP-binding enzyme [Thalassobacter stenotrophicus DSM 16310]
MTALLTVGEMLSTQARVQPDRIGARDLERSLTFLDWNTRSCRLANALLGLGLSKGDRVAVLAYNRVEWAEIYGAVAKAGLIAVPINFRLTGPEACFICKDSKISAVIAEAALADIVDDIRADLTIPQNTYILIGDAALPGWTSYSGFLETASAEEPDVEVSPDDAWCLMYTSGTTGNPKGAIRSHRGMAMLALMTQVELGLRRQDDALLVMPMCHANSLNFFTAFLGIGATVGSVANFWVKGDEASAGHNYPANSANCSKPDFPGRSNCPLRIICATSMPARVAAAELNDLKVCMGRVIFFMKRWSCSMMLFRYFTCRTSINQYQLCITSRQFMLNRPAAFDPLLSITTLSGHPLLAITLAKNAVAAALSRRSDSMKSRVLAHLSIAR